MNNEVRVACLILWAVSWLVVSAIQYAQRQTNNPRLGARAEVILIVVNVTALVVGIIATWQ